MTIGSAYQDDTLIHSVPQRAGLWNAGSQHGQTLRRNKQTCGSAWALWQMQQLLGLLGRLSAHTQNWRTSLQSAGRHLPVDSHVHEPRSIGGLWKLESVRAFEWNKALFCPTWQDLFQTSSCACGGVIFWTAIHAPLRTGSLLCLELIYLNKPCSVSVKNASHGF